MSGLDCNWEVNTTIGFHKVVGNEKYIEINMYMLNIYVYIVTDTFAK